MKISTRGRYALRIMVDLARNAPENGQGFIKLSDIAERQQISRDYLVQLVTTLKNAGLVSSASGKNGGYALSHPPAETVVLDIVEAAIGPVGIIDCVGDDRLCESADACRTRTLWELITLKMREVLQGVTLSQLVDEDCDLFKMFDVHDADAHPLGLEPAPRAR